MSQDRPTDSVRVAYLQKAPSGHSDSCLRALASTGRAEIFATVPSTLADSPFDGDERPWIDRPYPIADLRRDDGLLAALRDFGPDLLLVVGWEQRAYRRVARALRGSTRRMVCMDQQYGGTLKQRAGVLGSTLYLRPFFDGAFVAGARQRAFAERLGFASEDVSEGFYSCDVDAFAAVPPLDASQQRRRRAFAYVGRLSAEKRIDVLASAYQDYRTRHDDPWDLVVVGRGALAPTLDSQPGIELTGFTQPSELPARLGGVACLALPSDFEPWGVVVHEAVAAGLGVICTSAVGAADVFVEDGVNGRIVEPGDPRSLAAAMSWFHALKAYELEAASHASRRLSTTLTPESWAATVLSMVR